jgi:hypothetical protein
MRDMHCSGKKPQPLITRGREEKRTRVMTFKTRGRISLEHNADAVT